MAPTIAHLVLQTAQIETMEQWWSRVLDLHRVAGNDTLRFFTNDDEHHRLALIQNPNARPRDPKSVGLNHVAFTVASLTELLERYDALGANGIRPSWIVNHGLTTSLYYTDPDGNGVELQVNNYATMAEAAAYMHGEAFRANPIGVDWDPDDLLRRRRDGAAEDELLALVRPAS